jgi:Uma2 family endonuclease
MFVRGVGQRAIVRVQNPVRLTERSEPQPDLALLRPRSDFYAGEHPGPSDILLLVEVADTSVELHREVKVPLYARTGVSEVWIVNLLGECVGVYRNPRAQGYAETARFRRGQHVVPQATRGFEIPVEDLLV